MQYSYTGTATDRPVMEWLNTYAFPRETAHSDSDAATKEYMKLCNRLVAHGTTTVLIFGTIYKEACQRLAQGLRGFVGKVCMDRCLLLLPQLETGTCLSATWHPDLP
jgi:guanine deaminase